MADSDNESFASAESDHEKAELSKETVSEPPQQPSSSPQMEEKGPEVDEGELSESTPRGAKGEEASGVEQGGESEEKPPTASQSEPKDEIKKPESIPTSEGGKDTGDSGTKVEPSPAAAPASAVAATTTEASGKSTSGDGEGGGWGWGGWGKSLWSSVSTVTESAQALGQKVSSAIASVEDALGLPSPEDLAEDKDINTEEVSKQADEMVEHDIPPEEREPVLEEPHKMKDDEEKEREEEEEEEEEEGVKEGSEGESKKGEDQPSQPPSSDAVGAAAADNQPGYTGVSTFFSGIASMVQTTGKDFVSGGLDALENLGKKTMEVLTEGDPGLREKRSMIGGGKTPTLSELLREAKADSEDQRGKGSEATGGEHTPLTYSRLFDEYKGVVHLEALDLLSKECESKVRSGYAGFTGEKLRSLREKMDELTQAFQVEEEPEVLDDDSSQLPEIIELFSDITLPIKVDRLMKVSDSWRQKAAVSAVTTEPDTKESQVTEGGQQEKEKEGEGEEAGKEEGAVAASPGEIEDPNKAKRATCEVLYENGLRSLAELTSASIELFRKMAEISLLPDAQKNPPIIQAQKFNRLTVVVSKELDCLASVHSEAITELDLPDTNSLVTSLYLEASNSGSYVQDAFQLLLPVLKDMFMQQWLAEEPSANVLTRN